MAEHVICDGPMVGFSRLSIEIRIHEGYVVRAKSRVGKRDR